MKVGVEPKPVRRTGARQVDACVVLAGGLRASPLSIATSRSVLDLHVASERTVLDGWSQRAAPLLSGRHMRVAHGGAVPAPQRVESGGVRWELAPDTRGYRGPAGALRDACETLGGEGDVLVVEAARWIEAGLEGLSVQHRATQADITLGVNADGMPSGVYLIRRDALELVDPVGFIDIKEQWLPRAIQAGFDVRGFTLTGSGSLPLRTLPQFLIAARVAASAQASPGHGGGFGVVCPGSRVEAGTVLVDSIVMPGGVVEAGAVVVRSVVAPGGCVGVGEALVDGVAAAGNHFTRSGAATRRVVAGEPLAKRDLASQRATQTELRRREAVPHEACHGLAA